MKYFKNTELADIYHVSEKTVRNWIESASQGKLDLQLYTEGHRAYVANTPQNTAFIQKLVEKGKKYKNSRGYKTVTPRPEFYKTYSKKQIFDIISNLTIHREIPIQYNYLNGGAEFWDQYAKRLAKEEVPNTLTSTIHLMRSNIDDFDEYLDNAERVNVIDLGPGNGLPVKELLSELLKQNRLNRYIAIDISRDILDITRKQITAWFGDKVRFEGYVRDFSNERFDDLLAEEYITNEKPPLNLTLLLSGTICNFRRPDQALQAINNSLGPEDLFVYTTKLDTPNTRRYFDLGLEAKPRPQDFLFHFILDMLDLKEPLYELDQFFDEQNRARSISLRPRIDLSIEFKFPQGTKTVLLQKNEPILLWRYWHVSALDVIHQFDQSGFDLLQATKTKDQEYLLLASQIKINK